MHVAVLGAGYAGLALTRQLETRLPADVDLTLVDERDTHLVQHLIHRVIRDPSVADDLQVPLSSVLDRAHHRQSSVEAIDPAAGTVELADGELAYDVGAVCLGARTNFHGLAGIEAQATPLKRIEHAEQIREDALALCEAGGGTVVVGGAGLSGVQAAGELAALADETGDAEALDVHLLEQAATVAPQFPPDFSDAVAAELADAGVHVETDCVIEGATADAVELADGSERALDQLVWTGGIRGSPAMADERPTVRTRLQLTPRTFGLGDAVRVIDADGTAVPASAQTALDMADVTATNVARLVDHRRNGGDGFAPRLATYRDDSRGWLVTVGDGAVAKVGPRVLRGPAAKAIKTSVGTWYLESLDPDASVLDRVRATLGGSH